MSKVLDIKNLSMSFGGLEVLKDFNMEIDQGELVGLIGPNGAGKTTVFNIITGVYKASSGKYKFQGEDISKFKNYELVRKGMARTFQNIRLFDYMTVLENILISFNFNMNYGLLASILKTPSYWEEENKVREEAIDLLKIFGLEELKNYRAGSLSYGQQRKLEIARALASRSKLLLLDEPAAGMNPMETEELMKTIKFIREKFQISILLIEHDMKLVLGICERLFVLDQGVIIAQGQPEEAVNSKEVIRAYLGDDQEGKI